MTKRVFSQSNTDSAAKKQAIVICVGNELLQGSTLNTNATHFSKILTMANYRVIGHKVCADNIKSIIDNINNSLNADVVIINGGLGPTFDDLTREAVAQAFNLSLIYNASVEKNIIQRLSDVNINVNKTTKKQAYFPQGAEIIPNPNGTACGFKFNYKNCEIIVLPGPPKECWPMVEDLFANQVVNNPNLCTWRLLGINEGELTLIIEDFFLKNTISVEKAMFWRYPYIDLEVEFLHTSFAHIEMQINQLLAPYIVSRNSQAASTILHGYLQKNVNTVINLEKNIVGEILTGQFKDYSFANEDNKNIYINVITESDIPFNPPYGGTISFNCIINSQRYTINIPKSRPEIVDFATEFVCWSILKSLDIN